MAAVRDMRRWSFFMAFVYFIFALLAVLAFILETLRMGSVRTGGVIGLVVGIVLPLALAWLILAAEHLNRPRFYVPFLVLNAIAIIVCGIAVAGLIILLVLGIPTYSDPGYASSNPISPHGGPARSVSHSIASTGANAASPPFAPASQRTVGIWTLIVDIAIYGTIFCLLCFFELLAYRAYRSPLVVSGRRDLHIHTSTHPIT